MFPAHLRGAVISADKACGEGICFSLASGKLSAGLNSTRVAAATEGNLQPSQEKTTLQKLTSYRVIVIDY